MRERRPRSTGELLSDAMAVLRSHFKTLALLALPFCAVDLILREGGQAALASLKASLGSDSGPIRLEQLAQSAAAGLGGLGLLLGSIVVTQLLTVGVMAMAAEVWRGRRPAVPFALERILACGAPQVVTSILFVVVLVGAVVAPLILAGIAAVLTAGAVGGAMATALGVLGAALAAVLVIAVTLRFGLYGQAVVLEERFAMDAFARSAALMAPQGLPLRESAKFRLSLLFFVSFALSLTQQGLVAIPRIVLASAGSWSVSDGLPPLASMPLAFIVPAALAEVALNAAIAPFAGVLLTLFYFDLRVRTEALDLEDES